MKKIIVSVMVLATLLAITAFAAENAASVYADLYFEGNTAVCCATAYGNSGSDRISVTMTLYQGDSYIDSWSASGTGYVDLDGYATVDMGDYYTLEVEATINGRTCTDSVGGMCE